jgi:hypothetical protein
VRGCGVHFVMALPQMELTSLWFLIRESNDLTVTDYSTYI